eukprot:gene11058-10125_t
MPMERARVTAAVAGAAEWCAAEWTQHRRTPPVAARIAKALSLLGRRWGLSLLGRRWG